MPLPLAAGAVAIGGRIAIGLLPRFNQASHFVARDLTAIPRVTDAALTYGGTAGAGLTAIFQGSDQPQDTAQTASNTAVMSCAPDGPDFWRP